MSRVAKCGLVAVDTPAIRRKDETAYFTGIATCGSVWVCPVCSAVIRSRRSEEICQACRAAEANGWGVAMLTLTMSHHLGERLAEVWNAIQEAFSECSTGRKGGQYRAQWGIVGQIRAVEVTHGANGWHPHMHVLVFFTTPLDDADMARWEADWRDRWKAALAKQGRTCSDRHGVNVVAVGSEAAACYVAKVQDDDGGERSVNVGAELARLDRKHGRGATSRTPLQILYDFAETGDMDDLKLWHEWERASKSRRAIRWSDKFKALCGVGDVSDEELAKGDVGGDLVIPLSNKEYAVIVAYGAEARVLAAAERGGAPAVTQVIEQLAGALARAG